MTRTASSQSARIIAPRQSLVYHGTFPPRYAAFQNPASKEKGAPPSRSASLLALTVFLLHENGRAARRRLVIYVAGIGGANGHVRPAAGAAASSTASRDTHREQRKRDCSRRIGIRT